MGFLRLQNISELPLGKHHNHLASNMDWLAEQLDAQSSTEECQTCARAHPLTVFSGRCLGRVFWAGLFRFLQMMFDTDFGQFLPSAGRARTRPRLVQWSAALAMLFACSKVWGAQSQMSDTNPDPIDVGVLAVLDGEDTRKQWQPLLEGLSQALPHRQLRFHPLAPSDMESDLGAARLDFVITNPGHYVVMEARHGATRIATQTAAEGGDPAHAVGSAVGACPTKRSPVISKSATTPYTCTASASPKKPAAVMLPIWPACCCAQTLRAWMAAKDSSCSVQRAARSFAA